MLAPLESLATVLRCSLRFAPLRSSDDIYSFSSGKKSSTREEKREYVAGSPLGCDTLLLSFLRLKSGGSVKGCRGKI